MNPSAYPECNTQKAIDISGITLIEDVEKILADKLKIKYRNPTEKVVDGNCRITPTITAIIKVKIKVLGIR